MFRCSNPKCVALHESDPNGHCPTCRKPDGSGWSCVADTGFVCQKCGTHWPAGQKAMQCVTCRQVYCPHCKDEPTAHTFGCFSAGRE